MPHSNYANTCLHAIFRCVVLQDTYSNYANTYLHPVISMWRIPGPLVAYGIIRKSVKYPVNMMSRCILVLPVMRLDIGFGAHAIHRR